MNRTSWKTITDRDQSESQLALPEPAWGSRANPYGLAALTRVYAPISLKEMDAVALLNRTDTKFVLSTEQLLQALAALQPDYHILSVAGQRLNHYRTLYFDTPNFDLYNLHVNGRSDRYKVRSREYTDSRRSFLEVKHKTNKGRTIKERISTNLPVVQMTLEAENWLHGVFPYDSRMLEPKMWNTFARITLVSIQCCERVTLDVDLAFNTPERAVQLTGIVIAEVKMDSDTGQSPFLAQMHVQKTHPQGFSKYCIGVSMLYDQVKKNALKPKMLKIERMAGGVTYE